MTWGFLQCSKHHICLHNSLIALNSFTSCHKATGSSSSTAGSPFTTCENIIMILSHSTWSMLSTNSYTVTSYLQEIKKWATVPSRGCPEVLPWLFREGGEGGKQLGHVGKKCKPENIQSFARFLWAPLLSHLTICSYPCLRMCWSWILQEGSGAGPSPLNRLGRE